MAGLQSLRLHRSSYYAPIPIVTIDRDLSISDFNLAFQTLLGNHASRWKFQHIEKLPIVTAGCTSPGRQSESGKSEPPALIDELLLDERSLAAARFSRYRYHSNQFGWAELIRSSAIHLDREGAVLGMTLYWTIDHVERDKEFHTKLNWERDKQLAWDLYAISYDRVLPVLPFYAEVLERHIAAMTVSEIKSVLDIGAGTGNVAIELLKTGRAVTAVDLSRAMLERLRRKVVDGGAENISIVEQNAEELSHWRNGEFDGVTALLAFYDMTEPEHALQEAIRVLRPGGTIVVTEPKKSFQLEPLLAFANEFLEANNLYRKLEADWRRVISANRTLDPAKRGSPLRAEDIARQLSEAGFADIEMKDSHLGNCATIWARKAPEA